MWRLQCSEKFCIGQFCVFNQWYCDVFCPNIYSSTYPQLSPTLLICSSDGRSRPPETSFGKTILRSCCVMRVLVWKWPKARMSGNYLRRMGPCIPQKGILAEPDSWGFPTISKFHPTYFTTILGGIIYFVFFFPSTESSKSKWSQCLNGSNKLSTDTVVGSIPMIQSQTTRWPQVWEPSAQSVGILSTGFHFDNFFIQLNGSNNQEGSPECKIDNGLSKVFELFKRI